MIGNARRFFPIEIGLLMHADKVIAIDRTRNFLAVLRRPNAEITGASEELHGADVDADCSDEDWTLIKVSDAYTANERVLIIELDGANDDHLIELRRMLDSVGTSAI